MSETIVLDPYELASNRTSLDITKYVAQAGPDWGDALIAAFMADGQVGSVPVDFTVPNRKVTIPLNVLERGGVSFEELRAEVQALVGLWQREGGWLKREFSDGRKLYLDITNATLKFGGGTLQALYEIDTDVTLELETLPDWYGDEIELDTLTETTNPELVHVLQQDGKQAVIAGNFPYGNRCRLKITDAQGVNQRSLIAAFRSRHYDSASTAALAYEAEALTPLDLAEAVTLSGASGGKAVKHPNLTANWTPVLSTVIASGGANLTHTGTYRLIARAYSESGSAVELRALYDVGDLTNPTVGKAWAFPAASQLFIADLGEINLPDTPIGEHRWVGQIQAKGAAGGEKVHIDKLWLVPVDEFMARASAHLEKGIGLTTYAARDEFNQSEGALTGKSLPIGGIWAGAGSAKDAAVESEHHRVRCLPNKDADAYTGRFLVAGTTTFTNVFSQIDIDTFGSLGAQWVIDRYIDTSNWLGFGVNIVSTSPSIAMTTLYKKVAGVGSVVYEKELPTTLSPVSKYTTIALYVYADGAWQIQAGPQGQALQTIASGLDTALATGGALASGKAGFMFASTVELTNMRFDNFLTAAAIPNAAIFASKYAELRTDGCYRTDSTGTTFSQFAPTGNLPRLPCSGSDERPVELFVKASRGDLGELPDTAIDDVKAQVLYRPCYLFTPDEHPGS